MAARKGPLTEPKLDEMRRRIKTTLLLNSLQDHVLNGTEMSSTQIAAAKMLIGKTMPDLQSVTLTGEGGGPVQVEAIQRTVVDAK